MHMPLDIPQLLSQVSRYCADGQLVQAIALLQDAASSGIKDPRITGNLGCLLFETGQQQAGLAYLQDACADPEVEIDHWINLAFCLKHTGQLESALQALTQAARREPELPRLRWHRALLLLLLQQDIPQALEDYEYRWQVRDFPDKPRHYPQPLWQGDTDKRLTVLVYSEQGFGDTLQFLRYVPFIARQVGRVILEIQPELLRLVQYQQQVGNVVIPANVTVLSHDASIPLPAFDQQIALLSLPRALHSHDLTHPPLPSAYLAAPGRVNMERDVEGNPRQIIGLIWAGRPTHPKDAIRSFSLADCEPLWHLPDIRWVSLQKGRPASELAEWKGTPLLDWSEHLTDFHETARIMRNLDLVITADTATAHLAAALGIPTWIAINPIPDWRWGLNTEQSPWYQSVRLFRQSTAGQWRSVFEAMARGLRE